MLQTILRFNEKDSLEITRDLHFPIVLRIVTESFKYYDTISFA